MSDQAEKTSGEERVADDILRGAIAIGAEIGAEPHQVYYLYEKREQARRDGDAQALRETYPITKMGKTLIASRRQLRRVHRTLTSA